MIKTTYDLNFLGEVCFVGATASRMFQTCFSISHFWLRFFSFGLVIPSSSYLLGLMGCHFFNLSIGKNASESLSEVIGGCFLLYVLFSFCELTFSFSFFSMKCFCSLIYCLFSFLFFLGSIFNCDPFSACFDENNYYLLILTRILSFFVLISSLTGWIS